MNELVFPLTESLFLQMEQLEYVLGRLNAAPEVWQATMFSKAWQTLLVTPLTKGTCHTLYLYIDDLVECSHSVRAEVLNHDFFIHARPLYLIYL